MIKRIKSLLAIMALAGWAGAVHSTPMVGIESCSTTTPANCTFSFNGLLLDAMDGDTDSVGPPSVDFVRVPFIMPHLESLFNPRGNLEVGLTWDDTTGWEFSDFIIDYIDGMGNVGDPEMMDDLFVWHGFVWSADFICEELPSSGGCGLTNVLTEITFIEVAVGEWSVPEPGTLALFGLGLAGLGFARRKKA